MALPNELRAEKVVAVQQAMSKMSPDEIGALPPLDADDFQMFGALGQTYCFIDLNLRRAIEVLHHAKRLSREDIKQYPHYSDAALTGVVMRAVKSMDPKAENLEETLFRLGEIEHCRSYRNLVSHFAGKRFPNEDVLVFASKSDKDARRVMGKTLKLHHVHIAVGGRSELFEMVKLVDGHQRWLSEKVIEWDKRYLPQRGKAA